MTNIHKSNKTYRYKTSEITRISDFVVRKRYVKGRGGHTKEDLFERERVALVRAQRCRGLQQILSYDPDRLLLISIYCGIPLPDYEGMIPHRLTQAAHILNSLQSAGIWHRDIKPSNIMVSNGMMGLIDFGWARCDGGVYDTPDPDALGGKYKGAFGLNDGSMLMRSVVPTNGKKFGVKEIENFIKEIGSGEYRDGSSSRAGMPYHPIPFDNFKHIKPHKLAIQDDYEVIKRHIKDKIGNIGTALDIGCNVGFITFSLERDFKCKVYGIERDLNNFVLASALAHDYTGQGQVELGLGDAHDLLKFISQTDVALFLNTHMWLHKQHGPEKVRSFMKDLASKTKHLFFQTAHAGSGGKYRIPELGDYQAIESYLNSLGFGDVVSLKNSSDHGGERYLIYCRSYNDTQAR